MNNLPIHPPTPNQQEQFLQQLYALMARQVQSYHKHRHMGSSSSIPTELAQDLLESIDYTANQAGGLYARPCLEETLRLGGVQVNAHNAVCASRLEQVSD